MGLLQVGMKTMEQNAEVQFALDIILGMYLLLHSNQSCFFLLPYYSYFLFCS